MPIYKPSELHQFLESLQIKPKKGLSQNFLIDGNIIQKIASSSNVQPGDIVLEVGPGPGALTEALLNKGALVYAVEKDRTLAQALERLHQEERLKIFCDDIMTFPLENLQEHLKKGHKAKVIANLPYHLTTPILAHLVHRNDLFSSITVMVQKEMAERMTAKLGTSVCGSLTLFLSFFANVKYAFTVTRKCFYPVPSVDSAVVVLELKEPPYVSDREAFFTMTRTAFGHRRKMLRASLRELYPVEAITNALEALRINPQARPEELTLDNWLQLFESLRL